MLKPLTLAAVLLAAASPLAHAQEDGPDREDRGGRYERDARPDEDMPPYRDRSDVDRSRDVRHGDRWARGNDDEDEAGDGERGGEMRDLYRDRDRDDRDDKDRKYKDKDKDRAKRDRDREKGPRGERHGKEGRHGPPPPRAGFEIHMGPGQTLRVTCGDEDLADCIAAAKPVLDAFTQKASDAGTRVPPPPPSLVNGDTPPPPPPAGDRPAPAGATPPPPPAAPAN